MATPQNLNRLPATEMSQTWPRAVYALFTKDAAASKAVTAQYLAERLENLIAQGELVSEALKANLPAYLVAAIEHVTAAPAPAEAQAGE